MSPAHEAAAEISAVLLALRDEFDGEPSLRESVGVIAAQLIVMTDVLKRMLVAMDTAHAIAHQR